MSDTTTLSEQVTEASKAFAQTLDLENKVFQGQLDGAIAMTLTSFKELIALCKEAVAIGKAVPAKAQQNLADTAQQAVSAVQSAVNQATASPEAAVAAAKPTTGDDLDSSLVNAVGLSYENAVHAQQQVYITLQAATTEIISTILSVGVATLASAVKDAEGAES
jgi:hypothetical protein